MSGIFKGDSIYKSGGGGGGYKDGGQLIDGDFIKVENNTISSYDNVSRDPVNFYFEVKDGEILNSVVELTTAVNATINVYVVKNGFYYLLGNVGGKTVNAGDDYKINITGDSYSIEQVTIVSNDPEFSNIPGLGVRKIVKVNGLYWCTENETGDIEGVGKRVNSGVYDYQKGVGYQATSGILKNLNLNGWRVATRADYMNLYNYLGGDQNAVKAMKNNNSGSSSWDSNATGTSPVNFLPCGRFDANTNSWKQVGLQAEMLTYNGDTMQGIYFTYLNNNVSYTNPTYLIYLPIRLCKDV